MMSSPAQVLHFPMTVAWMVLFVAGLVTVMGASQGDSLIDAFLSLKPKKTKEKKGKIFLKGKLTLADRRTKPAR